METRDPVDIGLMPWYPLQFGHGFETVETRYAMSLDATSERSLQFGHGFETVETVPDIAAPVKTLPRFNSATALRPWRPLDRELCN